MTVQGWSFTQLGGDKETIELYGYAAPFGRPRAKPVVEPGTHLRQAAIRYLGSNEVTRHFGGTMESDFELNGRWMDKALGEGASKALVQKWQKFVTDNQPITIKWGDFLAYEGWVDSIQPKWESQTECTWVIKFLIDKDLMMTAASRARPLSIPDRPDLLAQDIENWANEGLPAMKKGLLDQIAETTALVNAEAGELFDKLDDLIGDASVASATAVAAVRLVDSFETATFAELQSIRTSIHQFKTAVLILQQTSDNITIDSYIFNRELEDDIAWLSFKADSDVKTTAVLGAVAQIDLASDRALRGVAATSYVAKNGDTWESISVQAYGDAISADNIRQANGIKYGERPLAGRTYRISR